jgi:glutathione S-transferase
MKLIGQYDSPFTRRVGITMTLYGLSFEHSTWSVFGNADELAAVNPLIRVPTLVLHTGEALIETSAIIDYLDLHVAPDQRLLPQTQPQRYRAQQVVAMASGVSDMAVRLFYEQRLHDKPSESFVGRVRKQLAGALSWLENSRQQNPGGTWFGGGMTQADIAVTCMFRHLTECHPDIAPKGRYPTLDAHCHVFESETVFQNISQQFVAPA